MLSWRGPRHPNAGGAEISTFEHAKAWVKAGHEVTIFTSYYKGGKREDTIGRVNIIRSGRQFFGVQIEASKWYIFGRQSEFDLVVDQFHGIPFFTPLYVRGKKLAFIHEVTKEVWRLNPWPWPFKQIAAFIGGVLEPLVFKMLYKDIPFMTVSESTKQDLVNWGIPKRNITVIHNGINIPRMNKFLSVKVRRLPLKEKKKTAIFLGSISKDKGIEDAIKIFYEIDSLEKGWQFWVVGRSDLRYLETIQRLVVNLGIFNKIIFFGYVTESKKFELLSKAHILVNPSIREGWGLVVIEGASVGTPTVGYNVSGLKDSIQNGESGILCNPNPKDCAKAVLSLVSNQVKYEKMRKDCIMWSKNFSWDQSSRESLRLIKKIKGAN